jgi:hypothetical protein
VRVIQDDLWLCSDCTQVACNGPHGAELTDAVSTLAGLDALGPHLVPDFDSNAETNTGIDEFSRVACASCKTHLAGYRARFAILGE